MQVKTYLFKGRQTNPNRNPKNVVKTGKGSGDRQTDVNAAKQESKSRSQKTGSKHKTRNMN